MKRDMDIARKILLAVDDSDKSIASVEGISEREFIYHALLLSEAGLVKAIFAPENAVISVHTAMIHRLTWNGHDFVDLIKDDTVWKKAKDTVIEKTGSWAFETLVDYLKDSAKSALPLAYGLIQVVS